MPTLTKELTKEQLDTFVTNYKKIQVENPNPKVLVGYFKTKYNLSISAYKTGKVVFQGDQNAFDNFFHTFKITKDDLIPTKIDNVDGIIGCDETGTGDFFGPMVTVACYVDNKFVKKIKDLGAKDSKALSDEKILEIFNNIKKFVKYEICVCTPKAYNELNKKYKNIKVVLSIAHNSSLTNLVKKMPKSKKYAVVMDQYVAYDKYLQYLEKAKKQAIKLDVVETKAENKYISVACASIIARATQLNYFIDYYKKIGFILPKGSSDTKNIIKAGKKLLKSKFKLDEFAKIDFSDIAEQISSK